MGGGEEDKGEKSKVRRTEGKLMRGEYDSRSATGTQFKFKDSNWEKGDSRINKEGNKHAHLLMTSTHECQ